ncbi:unnamed protein product, partial [Symbiodinium sp. CCMP2592]
DSEKPLSSRKTLVECSDQGSIPMSVDSFELYHLKLRKMSLEDPFHAMWKSILGGLKASGKYACVSLCSIWLNLNDGPWNSQKWFVTTEEGWREFKGMVAAQGGSDPLLAAIHERSQRFGLQVSLSDLKLDLDKGNFSTLHRRVTRGTQFQCHTNLTRAWLQSQNVIRQHDSEAKAILANESLMRTAIYIVEASNAARSWYSTTRSNLRDRPSCAKFNIDMASGKAIMSGISGLLQPLADATTLHAAGLRVEGFSGNKSVDSLNKESVLLLDQDVLAADLFKISTSMLFAWLTCATVRMFAFPSAFLGLIDDDAEDA